MGLIYFYFFTDKMEGRGEKRTQVPKVVHPLRAPIKVMYLSKQKNLIIINISCLYFVIKVT